MSLFERRAEPAMFNWSYGQRVALDENSWIEHIPCWFAPHAQLLADLLTTPVWEQRSRWMFTRQVEEPRLTAEYSSICEAPIKVLRDMAAVFLERYAVAYDSVWMNLYRDHRDSTAWHGDWASCKRAICTVPVLSLGATRRFFIRPKAGGRSRIFTVSSGDLVVMGGRCQRDWVHAVPKETAAAGPRVSVNFGSQWQNRADEKR